MTRIAGLSDLVKWPSRSILLIVFVCCGAASACTGAVCSDKAALVSALQSCGYTLDGCEAENVADWDVSAVTDMSGLFKSKGGFDGDLSSWDVSSVTTMRETFRYARSFGGDIANWDVSSVTEARLMFYEADRFNADIGGWDVSRVTTMQYMFREASTFNRDLNDWDVSRVTTIYEMFRFPDHARSPFNGDVSSWDVASVTNMYKVFNNAINFNSDVSNWDVSGVTTTASMFLDAHAFNADLSRWDVSGVTHMQTMFKDAETFDRDLGDWDVTAVTNNNIVFQGAEQFRRGTRCDPFHTPLTNEEICEAPRDPLPPGNTRIALQGSQSWYAMASSADGTILVTGSSDGELWKSTESGEPGSWDQLTFGDGQTLGILVDVTVSDDGQSIVVVQSTNKGPVRTSVDGGQHWRTSQPADDATPVVNTDADGCGSPGCSACEGDCDSDSQCAGNLQCFERTSSSDLVPGCASTGYHGESNPWDYCYDPTQGGSGPPTPPPATADFQGYVSVDSSSDGLRVVVASKDSIWTSANAGVDWVKARDVNEPGSTRWQRVRSSDDGNTVIAMEYGGSIWVSHDAGDHSDPDTWTEHTPTDQPESWYAAAINADGSVLVASMINPQTAGEDEVGQSMRWISRNGGASWSSTPTAADGPRYVFDIACSADGNRLMLAESGKPARQGSIWTSSDAGITWIKHENNGDALFLRKIALNADGTQIAVASHNGYSDPNGYVSIVSQPIGPPPAAPEEDYPCQTEITVQYSEPEVGPKLGPIVLGRGANGAQISLYPGTFTVSSKVYVCNGDTGEMERPHAYSGVATAVYDGSSSMSIAIYAIDVRQLADVDQLANFAPLVTSIYLGPQTVDVGETATITAAAYDFNAADTLKRMALSVFDTTTGTDTEITREDGSDAAGAMVKSWDSGREQTATLEFTPVVSDFTDSSEAAHRLIATVTGTDSFEAEGYGQLPFTVNRLVGVQIGTATFNRPRVSLDPLKQSHVSVAPGPAVAKFDIFDADSVAPYPYPDYEESHTYFIDSIGTPAMGGQNGNQFPTPGNCNGAGCRYTECVCTRRDDGGNDNGCEQISASQDGNEWTFTWNPWAGLAAGGGPPAHATYCASEGGSCACAGTVWYGAGGAWVSQESADTISCSNSVFSDPLSGASKQCRCVADADPTLYGVTYCELKVHFTDNTASASRTALGLSEGSVLNQIITEGLDTSIATILLEANPGTTGLNHPPAIRLFFAVHVDLAPISAGSNLLTTVTVTYEDADGREPSSVLGFRDPACVRSEIENCFLEISLTSPATPVLVSDPERAPAAPAKAWRAAYTFNGNALSPTHSLGSTISDTLEVYLKLTDNVDLTMVGYHEVATLTRVQPARRRGRRQAAGDAAAARTAAMTISIDENGRLTGQMEFPAGAVVSLDVDTAGDTAGGSTRAPDGGDTDRGDDRIQTDDGSSDRQLVIILALAGGVGCCCLLGAAICLGYAMLRRSGSAGIGPSPTRRPTKILVSGAAPGLDGPRKDPFAGFQTA